MQQGKLLPRENSDPPSVFEKGLLVVAGMTCRKRLFAIRSHHLGAAFRTQSWNTSADIPGNC